MINLCIAFVFLVSIIVHLYIFSMYINYKNGYDSMIKNYDRLLEAYKSRGLEIIDQTYQNEIRKTNEVFYLAKLAIYEKFVKEQEDSFKEGTDNTIH